MGLKYAARAGGRGRARWAGRAEPAHGRILRSLGRGACRGVYWGLRPLAPRASARQCRERSEATHGRRRAKPSDDGMTTFDTREAVKDSTRLRHAPKRFSLGRHSRFFGQDQRNGVALAPLRGPLVSAARSASASKRSLAQFGQSNTDSLFMCSTWPLAASMAYSYSMAL